MDLKRQYALAAVTMLIGTPGCLVLGWPWGGTPISITEHIHEDDEESTSRLNDHEMRITALEKAMESLSNPKVPSSPEPSSLEGTK